MSENEDAMVLAEETLTGDIRDWLLGQLKTMKKPWQQMGERDQRDVIASAEKGAANLVKGALELIASRGLPSMVISVGKFGVDGADLKGTYTCYASDENLIRARHLSERRAIFVLADPDLFYGERGPAKPDPDQTEMPAGDEE